MANESAPHGNCDPRGGRYFNRMAILLIVLAGCQGGSDRTNVALFGIDIDAQTKRRITVSGVSAGGYMAVQAHVAHADRIGGAAVVAGGPYHCAQGSVRTALGRCLTGEGLDVAPLVDYARQAADQGRIAQPAEMATARVWLFHSPADAVVSPAAGAALRDFYRAFVPTARIALVDDVTAAHGWPTPGSGAACTEQSGDYLNACGYDTAGELLRYLYGDLRARAERADPGHLVAADLSRFFASGSKVADAGYAYVPSPCRRADADCGLHIVFHGCRQGAQFVDDRFVRLAGFNEWAEPNALIVIYPQIEKSLFNPQGCWDWWGYTGDDYDLRTGKQVAGVAAIIDAFLSGTLLEGLAGH